MSWTNPSAVITQWRTQLLACSAVSALPVVEADFHYPFFAGGGLVPDTLPAVLLQEPEHTRHRYAEGALPLIGGTLKAGFYLDEATATDAGFLETFARNVIEQLGSQYDGGLAFKNYATTLSSEPKPAARAAGANDSRNLYRSVILTVQYGLDR